MIERYPHYPGMTERELDMVLAALRQWQATSGAVDPAILEIAENGRTGRDASLSDLEIEALCERLNAGTANGRPPKNED